MVTYGPVGRPRGRERITINEATGQAGGDKESRSCSYRPASIKSGFRLAVLQTVHRPFGKARNAANHVAANDLIK